MQLDYNVTGETRKSLVIFTSQILGEPSKYLGAPSFAYEVGPYRIDKNGIVTGPDNRDLAETLAEQHGFVSLIGQFDDDTVEDADAVTEPPAADAEPEQETLSLFDSAPQPCEVPQEAEAAAEPSEVPQETENPQDSEPPAQEATPATEDGILTIEIPLEGFTPEKLENLNKLVGAKAALLKAALGAEDLTIKRTPDTLLFPWFPADADAEHTQAYMALVSQLCKTAKEKTRVNAKEKATEGSQKYSMRCFLLGLGMVGAEFKAARKNLLSRLEGSSSFCTKASEERWKAKHTGNRTGGESEAGSDE